MKHLFQKTLLLLLITLFFGSTKASASTLTSFRIDLLSSANVNEAIDVTITALDENGNVKKDYDGTIFMLIPDIDDLLYVNMPTDGIYLFKKSDYGVKTFSKSLSFKTNGSFIFSVIDRENLDAFGIKNIKIGDGIQGIDSNMVEWLYDNGLTKYNTVAEFNSTSYFTREQAAKFYSQFAIQVLGKKTNTTIPCIFSDIDIADPTLKQSIITSCQLGIFKGSQGRFDPKSNINLEESVAVLMRILFGLSPEPTGNPNTARYQNYIAKASALGLIPQYGVGLGEPVTRSTIGIMMYKSQEGSFDKIMPKFESSMNLKNRFLGYVIPGRYDVNDIRVIDTHLNKFIIVGFHPSSGLLTNEFTWVFKYDKKENTLSMIDTAGTDTFGISDTHRIYSQGYCREGCDISDKYAENMITKKVTSLGKISFVSLVDDIMTYKDATDTLRPTPSADKECLGKNDGYFFGLGGKCIGQKAYETGYKYSQEKTLKLP